MGQRLGADKATASATGSVDKGSKEALIGGSRVSEAALNLHLWEVYCDREELLTMVQEEKFLEHMQTQGEAHTWRRKVRRLKETWHTTNPFHCMLPLPHDPDQTSQAAISRSADVAKRKEILQSLAKEFQSLSAVLDEMESRARPSQRKSSGDGNARGADLAQAASNKLARSSSKELVIAGTALQKKLHNTEISLRDCGNSVSALKLAIDEKDKEIELLKKSLTGSDAAGAVKLVRDSTSASSPPPSGLLALRAEVRALRATLAVPSPS